MTLATNVHALVSEHLDMIDGRAVKVPALLDQLEAAVKPDSSGGASSTSATARLPVNATALALWQDIDREARDHFTECYDREPVGRVGDVLKMLALVTDLSWVNFLEHASLDWCDRINNLLSPVKPYHPSHPCPACGQRFHGPERSATLSLHWKDADGNVTHPEEWSMECAACNARWDGQSLGSIAWAMATSG